MILLIMLREYQIEPLLINGNMIQNLKISDHIDKHSDHIDDPLVIQIIRDLNGQDFIPCDNDGKFNYFASIIEFDGSTYKLIWLLEEGLLYIGVITCFKDRRIK
jgi:hypothetical protein